MRTSETDNNEGIQIVFDKSLPRANDILNALRDVPLFVADRAPFGHIITACFS
jgi:hypothetical protein